VAHRTLIVGLGKIGFLYDLMDKTGKYILTHASAVTRHEDFELVGGVDFDEDKVNEFVTSYQVPGYLDLREALEETQPDLLILAIPTELHLAVVRSTLQIYKPKLILLEKPLAQSVVDAREILKMCDAAEVSILVNYMRRVDKGVNQIKSLIDSKIAKPPYRGVVWYNNGLVNNGSHFINLLEYWFGPTLNGKRIVGGKIDEQQGDCFFDFKEARIHLLEINSTSYSYSSIEIFASNGRIALEAKDSAFTWATAAPDIRYPDISTLRTKKEFFHFEADLLQLQVMAEISLHLKGKSNNLCTGESALATLESIENLETTHVN